MKRVLVIGCNGGFGELLSRRFAGEDLTVSGIDLHDSPRAAGVLAEYVRADVTTSDAAAGAIIRNADWIISAIPEAAALASLPRLADSARAGVLLADILSVKTAIVELAGRHSAQVEYLSLHPLFAPQGSTMQGNVAYVPVRGGTQSRELLDLLNRWGGNLLEMSADEHDRAMAFVQVIAHAAILAFGITAHREAPALPPQASTPVHAMLRGLVQRVTGGDAALYWDIQKNNPHAAAARSGLQRALAELAGAIDAGDADDFKRLFDTARRAFDRRDGR